MPRVKTGTKRKWRSGARSSPRVAKAITRLGRRIRRLREDRGLSQEEIAHRAKLDPKHWSALEHGMTNVTFASLVGIADALKINLSELVEGI